MELLVGLCNMALLRLGNSETIASLTESKATARLCNSLYRHVWDCTLRAHPWGFATKRATLEAAVVAAPLNWGFSYQMPEDCLFARAITVPGVRAPRPDQAIPFEVGRDADGVVCIFTDMPDAELTYTAKTDPPVVAPDGGNTWEDPLFNNAFVARLACELALALGKSGELLARAQQSYLAAISEARARDLSEGRPDREPEPDFLACRR